MVRVNGGWEGGARNAISMLNDLTITSPRQDQNHPPPKQQKKKKKMVRILAYTKIMNRSSMKGSLLSL